MLRLLLMSLCLLTFAGTFSTHATPVQPGHIYLRMTVDNEVVGALARVEIQGQTATFQFLAPLEIASAKLVFPKLTLELSREGEKQLQSLLRIKSDELFIKRELGFNEGLTVDEALAFAKSSPTLEPLTTGENPMPELLLFDGELNLGELSIRELQAKVIRKTHLPPISVSRVETISIDIYRNQLSIKVASTPKILTAATFLNMKRVSASAQKAQDFVHLQQKVEALSGKISAPLPNDNVIRTVFGKKKCEDDL